MNDRVESNALLGAALLTGAGLLFAVVGYFIAEINSWKDYILLGAPIVLFILGLVSIVLLRRGQVTQGTSLIFVANLILPFVENLLQRDIGAAVFIYTLVSSILLIWRSMPASSRRWASILTGVILLFIVLTELANPAIRISAAEELVTFIIIVTILLTISFIFQAVRETWGRSIRNKLLIVFIGAMVVATGTVAVFGYTSSTNLLQQSLEDKFTQHTSNIAARLAGLFNEQINILTTLSFDDVLQQAADESNQGYTGSSAAIQAQLDARDAQWLAADAADNDADPLVQERLTNPVASELIEFQNRFPDDVEVFLTDKYGGLVGSTHRTTDYYQADEDWWQAAYNKGQGAIYIGQPVYDQSLYALVVQIALPVKDPETGEITGILRASYFLAALNEIVSEKLGTTDEINLYVPGQAAYYYHAHGYQAVDAALFNKMLAMGNQGMVQMDVENTPSMVIQLPMKTLEGNEFIDNMGWFVVYHQSLEEAFAPINSEMNGVLVVMVTVFILAVAAAYFFSLYLVRPILQLTETAREFADGKLDRCAKVTSSDEVGTLASTFNSMTAQLQETLQGLEQRVADRTKALVASAEVTRHLASVTNPRQLALEVVEEVQSAFQYYHAHIYYVNEATGDLVMSGGTGDAGAAMLANRHRIPRDRGLVGRAAGTNTPVLVPDVSQAEGWLPNPLLPETRAEAAVPISIGNRVFGVLDVQHNIVNGLQQEDINLLQSIAGQIALTLQNARTLEETRTRAELETMVNTIGQKIQLSTSVEDTLQTAIRELGMAIGARRVKAIIARSDDPDRSQN